MTPFESQNMSSENVCTDNNIFGASDVSAGMTTVYTSQSFEIVFNYYKVTLLTVFLVLIIYMIYKSYWSPVIYKRELADVGYDHIPYGKNRALNIQRAQKARQVGHKLPPPYPNAWFALVESRDLKIGDVVPVDALGLNLCVYRGEDGTARVVDAYCPHLGAHMGVGGSVSGNCIRCPFHHWTFGQNGDCVRIPGVDKVPKGISIKTWPSAESEGAVWIWHDAEGRPPLWAMEPCPEISGWGYRGRNEFLISTHIQDISENGADVAHLNPVHSPSLMSDIGFKYPFINKIIGYHIWSAEWSKGPAEHIAYSKLKHSYIFMTIDLLPLEVTVHVIGPGHIRIFFTTPVGPIMLVQSTTPLGPLLQKVVYRIYTPFYNALAGLMLVYGEAFQFERDIMIWNSKRYVSEPVFAAKTDRLIRMYRTWYSQFYSENSIPFKDAIRNPLDW